MVKYICAVLIFFVAKSSGFCQAEGHFQIIGIAPKFKENTLLILEFTDGEEEITDSTFVVNGKFEFNGDLKAKAIRAMIRTPNFSDYRLFWLESSVINFNVEKGKLRLANINGSKTQGEQKQFEKMLTSMLGNTNLEREKIFIRRHPGSFVSVHLLSVYSSTFGRDTTAALFNNLSEELQRSSYGKSISDFISLNQDIRIGQKYVDFAQEDTKGNLVKLSDFSNRIVLLEFWGSWCGPCRKSNPELVKVYNEFRDRGFEIVGVGAETKRDSWLNAIQADGLVWTNLSDLKGSKNKAALIYGVSYYPTNFLIDRNGIIVARDLAPKKLRGKLKELLAE